MAYLYEDYIWRLSASEPISFDIQLPQDLEWIDEITWSPIQQTVKTTLSGALVIQESKQQKGRAITLQGKDDMAWIDRLIAETLMQARSELGMVMRLQYIEWNGSSYGDALHDFNVMFRHYEPPVTDLESVLRYDNFEPTSWWKVRGLRFMQVTENAVEPCSASSLLQVSSVNGTFNPSNIITGDTSGASATVLSFDGVQLYIYKTGTTNFSTGEIVRVDEFNYATIDSIG